MDSGTNFSTTAAIFAGIVGFGSALLGALLGSLTAIWVERRREDRQRRIAESAVILELALLQGTLEAAVHDKEIRRVELTNSYWHQFGPELINSLPDYIVKALHLYFDGMDIVKQGFEALKKPMHPAYVPYVRALLLSWAASGDRINQKITEYKRTGDVKLPGDAKQDALIRLLDDMQNYALSKVKESGLPTDSKVHFADGADFTQPPEGWTP